MVYRFCFAPLYSFRTTMKRRASIGPNLQLRKVTTENLVGLVEAYEERMTEGDWRAFNSHDLNDIRGSNWYVAYEDDIPEGDARRSNLNLPIQKVSTALLAMQVVQPTLPQNGCMLCGFDFGKGRELTMYTGATRQTVSEAQRLGEFTRKHAMTVQSVLPRILHTTEETKEGKGTGRIVTALRTYGQALRAKEAEPQIVLMATALEAIYSSSNEHEISFSLRLKISRWLGKSKEDRKCILINAKDFYGLRSKIVHGGNWRKKYRGEDKEIRMKELVALVQEVDSYIRRTLMKILSDEETFKLFHETKDLEPYWSESVLLPHPKDK